MKISRMGSALALAALAPLCALRAAAQESAWTSPDQVDGALASIRQAQAQTKKAPKAKPKPKPEQEPKDAPEPVGPSAPEQAWQKIVEAIRANGDFRAEKSMFIPARFGFRDVRGDEKGDHSVEHAGIVGTMNEAGLFEAKAGEFISEDWKLGPDGGWNVDKWLIATDIYGTVKDAAHTSIVKTADKKDVSAKDNKVAPDGPDLAAKFKSVIGYWAAKQ